MTSGLAKPRVVLSAGRSLGSEGLQEVYIAGKNQWYDEIIEMAGGTNAFEDEMVQFPAVTAEGLLRLDPDVIIEMAHDLSTTGRTAQDVANEWKSLPDLRAVKDGRIYVLGADYVTIPGPRFINVLEDVAKALHPEIELGS